MLRARWRFFAAQNCLAPSDHIVGKGCFGETNQQSTEIVIQSAAQAEEELRKFEDEFCVLNVGFGLGNLGRKLRLQQLDLIDSTIFNCSGAFLTEFCLTHLPRTVLTWLYQARPNLLSTETVPYLIYINSLGVEIYERYGTTPFLLKVG